MNEICSQIMIGIWCDILSRIYKYGRRYMLEHIFKWSVSVKYNCIILCY